MRISLSAVLSLTLVLTSHSMAQARGMTQAAGKMVICTGIGPKVIYVDAEGQPTQPPHVCPDCALSLIQGLLSQGIALTGLSTWHKITAERETRAVFYGPTQTPQARDPPGWL